MGKRLYSLEVIRVLAMMLVIIVHTKNYFFSPAVHSSVYAILKVIGTVGVPLFVIMTGYLMFNQNYEDDTYLQKYLKYNLFPLIATFELWNIIWNILRYTYVFDKPQAWIDIVKAAFFMGDTMSALWYLPMIIAIYLGMPILSIAVHRLTSTSYKRILLIALLLSGTIIPSIAPLLSVWGQSASIHSVLKMNIFGASVWGESVWMIYLLSGYIIYKGKLKCVNTFILSLLGIIIPIGIMYGIERSGHTVQHYSFILVVILSIATFEILTRLEELLKYRTTLMEWITNMSKISFGVYMMHVYVGGAIIQLIKVMGIHGPIGKSFSGFASVGYYFLFIVSIVFVIQLITWILQKNRFIRRYILLMK